MKAHPFRLLSLAPALALALAMPTFLRADEASARADAARAEATGTAAKAAMDELDTEIDHLDMLINNAPTDQEKASAEVRLKALKDRRSELRKTYVKARYDELKADVRTEADRLGAWTKRTFSRSSTATPRRDLSDAGVSTAGAALDLAAYKLRPTDTNKEEAKAALKALDARIDELDDRVDKMPAGVDRDAAKRRVKALEQQKDALQHEFNKARFNALVDSVQSEWEGLRR